MSWFGVRSLGFSKAQMEVVARRMRQTKAGTLVWVLTGNVVLSLLFFFI